MDAYESQFGGLNSVGIDLQDLNTQVWFDPTHNQAERGTPRTSGYGYEARTVSPLVGASAPLITGYAFFPTFPYRGNFNYAGRQFYDSPITEALLAYTFGYRGIMPLTEQPWLDEPYPYEENLAVSGLVY